MATPAILAEHLRKLTVGGEKAVDGENVMVEAFGAGGSIVRIKAGGGA